MKHTFDVTISQHDADVALRRFLFREAGWSMLFAVLFCLTCVVYDGLNGGIGILGIVIITVLLLLVITYVASVRNPSKATGDAFKALGWFSNFVSAR
ncbi:MAG: hypothetical protein ACKVJU_13510 [Verrucomicrobiales bacterium]|mgnify:CR=1 FL=1